MLERLACRVSIPRILVMTAIGLAAAYLVVIFAVQRMLLFPRPAPPSSQTRPSDAVQIWLKTSDGALVESWYLPPTQTYGASTPILIFFHGNGELIDGWAREFRDPRRWGIGVLLVEYPGYGRSGGSPSQSSITSVALAAYDWAAANPAVDSSRIVAYGRSLGGAAACALAKNRQLKALVVESTFTSIRRFAHQFGAVEFAIRDPFDSLVVMRSYHGPVLVLHGKEDEIIPFSQGQELARAAVHSEFHALPCGHNDCERPWSIVRQYFLANGVLHAGAN